MQADQAETEELEKLSQLDPPRDLRCVYHYTSVDTFLKIFNKSSTHSVFWASEGRYLNDPREFNLGLSAAKECLTVFDGIPEMVPTIKFVRSILHKHWPEHLSTYVVSFSTERDSLPQWRAYGDDGFGVAIGVRVDDMQWSLPSALEYCSYDVAEITHDLLQRFEEYRRFVAKNPLTIANGMIREKITNLLLRECFRSGVRLKARDFRTEEEVRLVVSLDPDQEQLTEYRTSERFGLVPYVEVPFPRERITQVVLGPAWRDNPFARTLTQFLAQHGSAAEVICSNIEYRPMRQRK